MIPVKSGSLIKWQRGFAMCLAVSFSMPGCRSLEPQAFLRYSFLRYLNIIYFSYQFFYLKVLTDLRGNCTLAVVDGFYCVPGIMSTAHDWKKRVKAFMTRWYENDMASPCIFDVDLDLLENLWLTGSVKHKVLPKNNPDTIQSMKIFMYPISLKFYILLL